MTNHLSVLPYVPYVSAYVSIAVGLVSCFSAPCNCPSGGPLTITAADPITSIALSGPPCNGAKYRCNSHPSDDNVLAADCTTVYISPVSVGVCVIDVTVGGMTVHLERQFVNGPAGECAAPCGLSFVAVNGSGYIDLRPLADGGTVSYAAP
jgi:hypothetical protein